MVLRWFLPALLLIGALDATASPIQGTKRHYPEPHPRMPPEWSLSDVGPGDNQTISVVIAVRQNNLQRVQDALRQASDPTSPRYGQWWNFEKMARIIDCQGTADQVIAWMRSASDQVQASSTQAGEWIRATLPVSLAQDLFAVKIQPFCHSSGQCRLGSMGRYSVPDSLKDSIDFIAGLKLHTVRRPAGSVHAHAKSMAATLDFKENAPGIPSITNLEARDRAFQVHVNIVVNSTLLERHCGNHGHAANRGTSCDDGTPVITQYESMLIPTHSGEDYLRAVNLTTPFREGVCTQVNDTLTCLIVTGPDVALVNYVSTKLHMRIEFADGQHSPWVHAPMLGYPTKMMTVNDVRKLYSMPQAFTDPSPQLNSQAVANFLGISVADADTIRFQRLMGSRTQPAVNFIGPNNSSSLVDVEGSIDLQWIQGMGRGVPTTYHLTTGGEMGHEPFLNWMVELSNQSSPAYVQSLSYGENEDSYSEVYQMRGDIELMKLGLRGVSVLAATGDTGVQGAAQAGGAPPVCAPFQPVWPASSPYVTAVGGTQFSTHSVEICDVVEVFSYGTKSGMPFSCPDDDIGEIACSADTGAMITSGGGFSNRYARPWYQQTQVAEYLNHNHSIPPLNMFNVTGRAYPDIAAISQNVPAVFEGELVMVGGTSASAPIASGIVASLNGAKLAIGKPTLGFLNPLLYHLHDVSPETYIDVRVGNNSGGNRLGPTYTSCESGFKALPGWDAVTGLGSLNFDLLYTYMTNGSRPL